MGEAEVYEEVREDLMRYAVALVGPVDAEDVVSSVVTRVLGRPGGLSGLREPKPYLMRAVLNEVRARHRSRRSNSSAEDVGRWAASRDSGTGMVAAEPAPGDGRAEDIEYLVAAVIGGLPPRQRAAAFLVFVEEHTPTEAAALMGCRPGTVRRYLHLARRTLKEALDA